MSNIQQQDREAILSDLLSEKSLWAVYRRSRAIPFSRINTVVGAVTGIAATCASCWSKDANMVADHVWSIATLAFNTSISLLGFLLAGFSFFATVADKSMFCSMAEVKHEESGLSYLKYNFYVFMRVFYEYSIMAILSYLLVVALQSGSGIRIFLQERVSIYFSPQMRVFALAGTLGLITGCFVYLLFQLKSFIFNVFHVVMTSIRWALEQEYEKLDKLQESNRDIGEVKCETVVPPPDSASAKSRK